MIHHIKQTADGFITLIGGLGFFAVSVTTLDTTVRIVSGILGGVASLCAIVYYINAFITNNKKQHKH